MKINVVTTYTYKDGTPGKIEQEVRGKKQAKETAAYHKGWVLAHKRNYIGVKFEEKGK